MPVSIFTFLSDQYQHTLKVQAEAGNDRFEDVMRSYINIFINELSNTSSLNSCKELLSISNGMSSNDRKNLLDWLSILESTIKTNINSYQVFMEELIDVYITYIKGDTNKAYSKLGHQLITNNLLSNNEYLSKFYRLTFRGRNDDGLKGAQSTIGNMWLESEFYHVPFDKLGYAANYRFSLTGHPFIYLGASVPTVLLELRKDLNSIINVHLSSWKLKENENFKLYDISNFLYDLINLIIVPIFHGGNNIDPHQTSHVPNINTFNNDFMKFIISQFCTFRKHDFKGQVFVEQYVLPQLMTNQIKNNPSLNYDGFIFPSTQYQSRANSINNKPYFGVFKNNIALFTTYSNTERHDKNVIDKFDIQPFDTVKRMEYKDLNNELDKFTYTSNPDNSEQIRLKASIKVSNDYLVDMQLDNIPVYETEAMKLEFAEQFDVLKKL